MTCDHGDAMKPYRDKADFLFHRVKIEMTTFEPNLWLLGPKF